MLLLRLSAARETRIVSIQCMQIISIAVGTVHLLHLILFLVSFLVAKAISTITR
jgi:hypothetical protein